MERYKIMLKKHSATIAIAVCIAASIGLAIAYPHTDIEIHREATYEQN